MKKLGGILQSMSVKMKVTVCFLALAAILIFGLLYASSSNHVNSLVRLSRTTNAVAFKTGKEIEKEFPYLHYAGVGGAMKDGVIEQKTMIFQVRKILSKDEGIMLITRVLDQYLKNIYAEKKLQEYLKQHPFTYKNLEVILFISTAKGEDVFYPDISDFGLEYGILIYRKLVPSEKYHYETKSRTQESYEEEAKRLGVWKESYVPYETSE